MEKVTGIGGVFYRAEHAESLREFYRESLGIEIEAYGGSAFLWRDIDDLTVTGTTVWSVFDEETTYFAPSESRFMVNFRVRDLDRMRAQLGRAGAVVDERVEMSEFGRFGWARDPEGNKIELWEPPPTERRGTRCWIVDAFTERPFSGNPAAVCLVDAFPDEGVMLEIARENALSETAFLVPRAVEPEQGPEFDLRWFTPRVEVDLCGHATLASAHVIFSKLASSSDRIVFHTKSGPLTVTRGGSAMSMDFPARRSAPATSPEGLASALGLTPVETLAVGDGLVCVLASAEEVRALAPDMTGLAALDAAFVCVTARADAGADVDFVSRFFAPKKGVPEDPVTGSAHCALAPMWSARLDKSTLRARQLSERGGDMTCEVRGERVVLTGSAVTVKVGVLLVV
jgi:PhzF family phenazine biosynthesis protein